MTLLAPWYKPVEDSEVIKLFQSVILLDVALLVLSLCFCPWPNGCKILVGGRGSGGRGKGKAMSSE